MKKKTILLCVLALAEPEKSPEAPETAVQPAEQAEPAQTESSPETQPTETPEETTGPVMLEDEGELEIIVPDDQDSDGF